jgi:hypothetical protein
MSGMQKVAERSCGWKMRCPEHKAECDERSPNSRRSAPALDFIVSPRNLRPFVPYRVGISSDAVKVVERERFVRLLREKKRGFL